MGAYNKAGSQNGNILFLILIAVALFAALSYAVTRSSRLGGSNVTKDKMGVDISAFLQNNADLVATITRMNLGGVAIDGFNFSANGRGWSQPCHTTTCSVFTDAGGTLPTIKRPINDYLAPAAQNSTVQYGDPFLGRIKGVGTDANAELLFVYVGASVAFCKQINKALGIGEIAPIDDFLPIRYEFSPGTAMPDPPVSTNQEITDVNLVGKHSFCVLNGNFSNTEGSFVQVLIPR